MEFPNIEAVKNASHIQICRWHRYLPSGVNESQYLIQDKIHERYNELGGMTPEISKQIGW